ncbi:serine/threonine protein phosphatase [Leptospira fletcheri]|uniref:Serine/threonine protein phosphatase n=1 Tax=Leptospira fletcheri TaxID=2484981 RepID=A0A4R9GFM3_9LEPT|nr:7TM diverse intracellular signaling domain-containing protein [Leptospira fletcheri]TGK11377.1 serine/threonine protein phosphatase [Leptospira fletcheri]
MVDFFRKIRSTAFICFLLLGFSALNADEVRVLSFPLSGMMKGVPLNQFMSIAAFAPNSPQAAEKDPNRLLSEDSVRKPMEKDSLSFSFTDEVFWLKLRISSGEDQDWFLVLNNPGMEEFAIYRKENSGEKDSWKEIDSNKRISYVHAAYRMHAPANSSEEFLIRAASRRSVVFNFQAWSPKEFASHIQSENLFLGVFFGAIGIMLIYNGFLAFVVKDSSYFFYVFYLLFYALWQFAVSGVGARYLVQTSPIAWNDYLVGFAFLSVAFSLLFTRSFLHMERETGWKDRVFLILAAFAVLGFFVSLIPSAYELMMKAVSWYPFLAAGLVVYSGFLRLRRGYKPARYFLLAWSVLIVSVLVTALRNLSWIPDSFLVHWSAQFGSVIEMTLLSFALAHRIKTLEKDSLQARLENYESQLKLTEIEQELKIARELQESILPDHLPKMPNLQLSVRNEFASSVGGDFYDFHYVGPNKLGIFLSDVSGHGIPAAIIASMVKLAFSIEARNHEDPAEVLRNINRSLSGKYGKHYITAAYLLVDGTSGKVTYSNAGHPPLVAIARSSGTAKEIFLPGWIMGMDPSLKNSVAEFQLEPGDRLIIYTDGITEARNQKGEIFGFQRFYKLLGENIGLSGESMAEVLFKTVREFTGNRKHFEDDLTLIVLDFQPASEKKSLSEITSTLSRN